MIIMLTKRKHTQNKNDLSISLRGQIIRGLVFPLIVIALWELAARQGAISPYFLPSPSSISHTYIDMLSSGVLQKHLFTSLQRLIYGFLIAVTVAIPIGILVGKTRTFRHWVNPTLSFLQQIPPIAWIPIFILWLGIDEASKVAVIVYAAFFPIFLNTVQGVISVDPKLIEVGRSFMLTPGEMIRRIYIPSAAMNIFVGLRLGLSNCWRALVGAELIAASSGLGSLIMDARNFSQADKIFVGIFTIGLAGLLIDSLLRRMESKLMPWKKMYQAGGQS